MAKLQWDKPGERFYETGVSKGVLFVESSTPGEYENGVPWNGLTNVTVSPTGAEPSALYADNIKYLNLMSVEELEASIEAYTYPDEFAECDGSAELLAGIMVGQQPRKQFAFAWQTRIGNDSNNDLGYKIHLMYGCLASPSEKSYDTVNDTPEAITFSWDLVTTPVDVPGFKPTALITIDTTKFVTTPDKEKLEEFLQMLYGVDEVVADNQATPPVEGVPEKMPTLPMPEDILRIFGTEG